MRISCPKLSLKLMEQLDFATAEVQEAHTC